MNNKTVFRIVLLLVFIILFIVSLHFKIVLGKMDNLMVSATKYRNKNYDDLTKDEENYISCRFCGEGIPNWKQENAREHTAECPINNVSEVLIAVKKLKRNILENTKQDNIHEQNSTMPGRSIQ